jgi:hypothetical protein
MSKKDPFAQLRSMGVTMSVVERQDPPQRPGNRRKATPKKVVADVRKALEVHCGQSAASIAWALVPELRDYCEGMWGGYGAGSYPHDPDDFSRCRRIVALIPDGASRIGEVAAAFPKSKAWALLAPAWAELEALFAEESRRPDRHAPNLYKRMQELTR